MSEVVKKSYIYGETHIKDCSQLDQHLFELLHFLTKMSPSMAASSQAPSKLQYFMPSILHNIHLLTFCIYIYIY